MQERQEETGDIGEREREESRQVRKLAGRRQAQRQNKKGLPAGSMQAMPFSLPFFLSFFSPPLFDLNAYCCTGHGTQHAEDETPSCVCVCVKGCEMMCIDQ